MIFNKFRNDGSLTLQDLFGPEMIQSSLEKLNWIHAENDKGAWEYIKISEIEKESEILSHLMQLVTKRKRRGDFIYSVYPNRLEREGDSIKPKRKFTPDLKFSQVFKEVLKPIKQIKGYVKVE